MDKNDVIDKVGELLVVFDRALKVTPSSKPKQKTLLTDGLEFTDKTDDEIFQILMDICYEHYTSGHTEGKLDELIKIIKDLKKYSPCENSYHMAALTIGKATLYSGPYGNTPVTVKSIFKPIVKKLLKRASIMDDHPRTNKPNTGVESAYVRIDDLIFHLGITNKGKKYSPRTLSNW